MVDPWQQDLTASAQGDARFEQKLANELAREFLAEQRRARRWGIAFKLFFALYLLFFLGLFLYGTGDIASPGLPGSMHTALVDIRGIINDESQNNADTVAASLRAAYEDTGTAGVIIRINSPGGSPVQAGYINDEIRRLKQAHPEIPTYAVISDICASGGYYVAVAADRIYADKASLVGSIGVIMASFGFVDTLEKLGMERRVYHAGEHKNFLDPFAPENEADARHVDQMLDDVYQQFVQAVKEGRGERLADDEQLFSGLIWTGEQSVELGLVDELGSAGYVAREVIGAEEIVDFTATDSLFEEFSKRIGAVLGLNNGYFRSIYLQ